MALQAQIYGCDGPQQVQGAVTVGKGMEHFQGYLVMVIVYPDQIPVIGLKGHRHTGIHNVRLDEGPGSVIGLQISPKQPFSQCHLEGRETGQCQVHGFLQKGRVPLLFHDNGDPVHAGKVFSLQRGIYICG